MENSLIIQMFVIYCTFLVIYGIKLKIWKSSKTTEYVIVFAALLSLIYAYCSIHTFIGSMSFGLGLLFIRAVVSGKDLKNV